MLAEAYRSLNAAPGTLGNTLLAEAINTAIELNYPEFSEEKLPFMVYFLDVDLIDLSSLISSHGGEISRRTN